MNRCVDYPHSCDGHINYVNTGYTVGICGEHRELGRQMEARDYDSDKENKKPRYALAEIGNNNRV